LALPVTKFSKVSSAFSFERSGAPCSVSARAGGALASGGCTPFPFPLGRNSGFLGASINCTSTGCCQKPRGKWFNPGLILLGRKLLPQQIGTMLPEVVHRGCG